MIPLPTLSPAAEAAAPPARRLAPGDLPWAADLLSAALADHPALAYVCSGPRAEGRAAWLLRGLVRFGLRYGTGYANPEGTALTLWLPGAVAVSPGRLLRAGLLPAAPWRLGLAGCGSCWPLLAGYAAKAYRCPTTTCWRWPCGPMLRAGAQAAVCCWLRWPPAKPRKWLATPIPKPPRCSRFFSGWAFGWWGIVRWGRGL